MRENKSGKRIYRKEYCSLVSKKAYLGNQEPKQIQYASPMEAESLKYFPNVYMEVAEFDSLRDEGIAFAERLRSEGVFTELHEVKGACHGFETALENYV